MTTETATVLTQITEFYGSSGDFNGLPVSALRGDPEQIQKVVIDLIQEGLVDLVRGDIHPNPHIKALPPEPPEDQVQKIKASGLIGCLYPSLKHLADIGAGEGEEAPFTRELKRGEPQLDFRVFDLRVLEWYRNDPRFSYVVDDIHGQITQKAGTVGPRGVLQDGLEFLEFGFAYSDEMERGVAIFLRYLHDLPTEQQLHLANNRLESEFRLHPDFYRTQIIGDFPERVSIYDAFLQEKHHINEMCSRMGKPALFRSTHKAYERPAGFGILIRPTKKEYGDFALLLDQLLSDDLNREFFKGDVLVTERLTREDGSEVSHPIGGIKLLEAWVKKHFKPKDPEPLDDLFRSMRAVRAERQKPAHKADDNEFNQMYVKQQRELIVKAFDAVRTIRMVLENHPANRSYEVEDWLREAKVWSL